MQVSVTLDTGLVEEAVRVSRARSKREAIETASKEFIRRRRLEKATARGGKIGLTLSVNEFAGRRAEE